MLSIDLSGKTVVVVGGSRGIGAAIVSCAAEAGARVAWSHSGGEQGKQASAELAAQLGGDHEGTGVDCRDAKAMTTWLSGIEQGWGGIHGLVYNAGLTSPLGIDAITEVAWKETFAINLEGAFHAIQGSLEALRRARGSVVFIGSAAVHTGGGGRADYVAAKAGLEGFAKALTKECASDGVRVNTVHPSLIATDLLKQRYPDPADRKAAGKQVPLGRLGMPEDIAYLTTFLLSDLAAYTTGQAITVDGGRTHYR